MELVREVNDMEAALKNTEPKVHIPVPQSPYTTIQFIQSLVWALKRPLRHIGAAAHACLC